MRIALRCALILVIGASLVAPPVAALADKTPIESLAVRNPKQKRKPVKDRDTRPPREKKERREKDKEERPSRPKPDKRPTPRPKPPEYIDDEPVLVVVEEVAYCPVCWRREMYCICWYEDRAVEPMSFGNAYAVLAGSTAAVNLFLGMDNRSEQFFGVGGLVLGGVGLVAALTTDDDEARTAYALLGLASIGLAVLNLSSDDPETDPVDPSGVSSSARVAALSLSF